MTFKRSLVGTSGPKVCHKNIPHTIAPPPPVWNIDTSRLNRCFHVVYTNTPTIRMVGTKIHQTNSHLPILVSPCEIAALFHVLIWQQWHLVCSFPAVAHLHQGYMCCAFRDTLLHTLVVTSGYLSCCCLFKLQAVGPFSSGINKAFSPRELTLIGYFRFWTSLCKS